MEDLVEDIRQRARLLHAAARRGDPDATARVRVACLDLRALDDDALRPAIKRRHALGALASELGFTGWPHLKGVLEGQRTDDLGTLMHVEECGAYWNIWSASHGEAKAIRADHGGYLLAYRHQFFIVEGYYVEALGLDPDDPDWARIDRDWTRPTDRQAWTRLTRRRLQARLG